MLLTIVTSISEEEDEETKSIKTGQLSRVICRDFLLTQIYIFLKIHAHSAMAK